ncbi:GNAT family N-acetyltransferase [Flexivirga meconopsidis]|uniref:GNAT family N-acetyltransferase n=1 Tax=Flexivirga meconopsidis TaxID=2977121 RepID=UPI00223EF780|nr:GNAT family N-acetyltransferase [Flexivirga meconopsidis]
MIRLILPTARLRESFLESLFEFESPAARHGYGTRSTSDEQLQDPSGFADWLAQREAYADPTTQMPEGLVHDTVFWIVDDTAPDRVLGSLSLRHELNEALTMVGGHIGYGVRPSARQRGVATQALRLALDEAKSLGLQRVLLTCDEDNPASARTIERCGGVRDEAPDGIRRYWIELSSPLSRGRR